MNETFTQTADAATQPDLSVEEISAKRQEMLNFYKDQIDFMTVQLEFEKLSADIEDNRLRRLVAMVRQAQLTTPPSEEEMENQEEKEKGGKRNLKKV